MIWGYHHLRKHPYVLHLSPPRWSMYILGKSAVADLHFHQLGTLLKPASSSCLTKMLHHVFQVFIYIYIPSLKLTPNFTPLKIGQKKRKEIVFQPSIFRCETVSFREGIIYIIQIHIYVYHLEPPNDLMTSNF